MRRLWFVILWLRWLLGATILMKRVWYVRCVSDRDTLEELLAWTKKMKADGWEDMLGVGERLYLCKWVERWPYPEMKLT